MRGEKVSEILGSLQQDDDDPVGDMLANEYDENGVLKPRDDSPHSDYFE